MQIILFSICSMFFTESLREFSIYYQALAHFNPISSLISQISTDPCTFLSHPSMTKVHMRQPIRVAMPAGSAVELSPVEDDCDRCNHDYSASVFRPFPYQQENRLAADRYREEAEQDVRDVRSNLLAAAGEGRKASLSRRSAKRQLREAETDARRADAARNAARLARDQAEHRLNEADRQRRQAMASARHFDRLMQVADQTYTEAITKREVIDHRNDQRLRHGTQGAVPHESFGEIPSAFMKQYNNARRKQGYQNADEEEIRQVWLSVDPSLQSKYLQTRR